MQNGQTIEAKANNKEMMENEIRRSRLSALSATKHRTVDVRWRTELRLDELSCCVVLFGAFILICTRGRRKWTRRDRRIEYALTTSTTSRIAFVPTLGDCHLALDERQFVMMIYSDENYISIPSFTFIEEIVYKSIGWR